MNTLTECEQFHDHRRAICRGERPDLSPETINKYRALWGLAPLLRDAPRPTVPVSVPNPSSQRVPTLSQRVVTFAAAVKDHVSDGLAKCNDEEIQSRLAICEQCPSFTGSHCRECGCACNTKSTFFNKLAWRSEKCPLANW